MLKTPILILLSGVVSLAVDWNQVAENINTLFAWLGI